MELGIVHTVSEALHEMQNFAHCKVHPCVFPTIGNLQYYISEHGDVFSTSIIRGQYKIKGPIKTGNTSKSGKRNNGARTYRLMFSSGRRVAVVHEELLVYCTFILGYWRDDIKIGFKNGDASDMRPANLKIEEDNFSNESVAIMRDNEKLYQECFQSISKYISFMCWLSIEDAYDVAQDTFLYLSNIKKPNVMTAGNWAYYGRLNGLSLRKKQKRLIGFEGFDCDGVETTYCEVDLLKLSPRRWRERIQYFNLTLNGYTIADICKETGVSYNAVTSGLFKAREYFKKILRDEQNTFRY